MWYLTCVQFLYTVRSDLFGMKAVFYSLLCVLSTALSVSAALSNSLIAGKIQQFDETVKRHGRSLKFSSYIVAEHIVSAIVKAV